jgi:Glycosyl transferase family 2
VIIVHGIVEIQPTGGPTEWIERGNLSSQQAYQHWEEVARLYGHFLQGSATDPPSDPSFASSEIRVATIKIDHAESAALDRTLKAAYDALQSGDILVVDLPNSSVTQKDLGLQRDLISRALFNAGFDCPMIWAGRKVLEAENRHSLFNRFLPSGALGACPRIVAGIGASLDVEPRQMMAITRRGSLAPPNQRLLRLSVVMPVYNEKGTFREVIESLLAKAIPGFEIEICVVESNSTDGSRDDVLLYANHPRVRLLLEDKPSGKGHAVRSGFKLSTGDIVLIQDADLEYDLSDYEKLLDPIRKLEASFVLGSRHPSGKNDWHIRHFSEQRGISDVMNIGHLFFTWFLNVLFGQRLRDPFTMYKVFRRDCINNVDFECNRFDFDVELFAKLIRQGFQPIEIGVRYSSRSFDEGKKVSVFGDPPTWIRAGLRHRFSRLHVWPKHR